MSEASAIPLEGEEESGPVGHGRLRRIVAYGRKVLDLGFWLERVEDTRRKPLTPARLIAATVFYTGLLRIRSFNALEPRLGEKPFLGLVGAGLDRERLCSVDTVGRSLSRMDLSSVRAVAVAMLAKAERNKVFREGWHGALRYEYLHLRSYGRDCGKDVTRTLSRLVDLMLDELACSQSLVWDSS
jgi:hypothetical protein